jgi:HPr kinase/phosphorylase
LIDAMAAQSATIHGSAVLVGRHAILIRGQSGAGKSRLALDLIEAGRIGQLTFARLVADDRVALEASHGRLLARPPTALAGLIEVRGLGIRHLDHEAVAVIGQLVDLGAADAVRLPEAGAQQALISGIELPILRIAPGIDPLPTVLALLLTVDAGASGMAPIAAPPKSGAGKK